MSEENKNPQNENGQEDLLSANAPPDNSGETEELEQIAELFQQEYDKTKQEYETAEDAGESEESPHGWDQTSHEYPQPPELSPEDICIYCGVNPKDKLFSETNEACQACRKRMTRYPLPVKSILAVFVVVAALLTAVYVDTPSFSSNVKIAYADKLLRANRASEASEVYFSLASALPSQDIFGNFFYHPLRVTRESIDLLEKTGQPNSIAQLYDTLPESVLWLPQYKRLTVLKEQTDAFMATLQEAYDVVIEYSQLTGDDFPYDEVVQSLDDLIAASAGQSYPGNRKAAVLFYKYSAALLAQKDLATLVAPLAEIQTLMPDALWLYAEYLGYGYARLNEADNALAIVKAMKKQNENDAAPYAVEAAVYRMQRDYDNALKACDEGQQANPQNSFEVVRQKAIVLLLQGKASEAVAEFKEVASTNQTLQNYNTLAICALAAGDTATYDEIVAVFDNVNTQNGYEENDSRNIRFSQNVQDFKNGTKTAEEIFLSGAADVL
ncbi:MAG: hypothetical protein LBS36_02275 [Oscillospiraceae bacterium]|jgi:tetratricopeptide (TPR) repeat protein|nr:hypothetical protein [Oscillospiraceae bacterium]